MLSAACLTTHLVLQLNTARRFSASEVGQQLMRGRYLVSGYLRALECSAAVGSFRIVTGRRLLPLAETPTIVEASNIKV